MIFKWKVWSKITGDNYSLMSTLTDLLYRPKKKKNKELENKSFILSSSDKDMCETILVRVVSQHTCLVL